MRMSLASWSLAMCSLPEAAGIANALRLDGIDVGYRHASAIDRERVLSEPEGYAAELRAALPIEVANVWHLFGADRTVRQLAGPADPRNLPDAQAVLRFCRAVGAPALFVLPGLIAPGKSRLSAKSTAVSALGPMVDAAAAAAANVTLTVEPHVHS